MRVRLVVKKNNLPQVRRVLQQGMPEIIRESTVMIGDDARRRAPEAPVIYPKHGYLKTTIVSRPTANPNRGLVVTTASFARFVEWPTVHNRAQPFMVPAAEAALLPIALLVKRKIEMAAA